MFLCLPASWDVDFYFWLGFHVIDSDLEAFGGLAVQRTKKQKGNLVITFHGESLIRLFEIHNLEPYLLF